MSGLQVEESHQSLHSLLREDDSKELVFERLRDAIDALLDAATPAAAAGDAVGLMHEAVVEARASLDEMRSQIAAVERQLAGERGELEDAERRGKLAEEIEDWETVEVAKQFAAKHSERVSILERKLEAHQAEAALAAQEFLSMREQLKEARQKAPGSDAAARIESAWRNIEGAGGVRPELDLENDLLRSRMDATAKEAVADERSREFLRGLDLYQLRYVPSARPPHIRRGRRLFGRAAAT